MRIGTKGLPGSQLTSELSVLEKTLLRHLEARFYDAPPNNKPVEEIMALPSDESIQIELMQLLSSAPNGEMHCRDVYRALEKRFPALTWDEVSVPYRNSVSHFANRVQFAREHLVEKGWLLRPAAGSGRGIWKVSSKGRAEFAEFQAQGAALLDDLMALTP